MPDIGSPSCRQSLQSIRRFTRACFVWCARANMLLPTIRSERARSCEASGTGQPVGQWRTFSAISTLIRRWFMSTGGPKRSHQVSIRAALSRKFKVICTLHDYFSACPNGSFFNYATNTICELQPLSGSCIASQCDRRHYGHKLWRVARQFVQNRFGGLPRELRHFIVVSPFSERILKPFLISGLTNLSCAKSGSGILSRSCRRRGEFRVRNGWKNRAREVPQLFAEAASQVGCEAVFIGDGDQRADVVTSSRESQPNILAVGQRRNTSARWSPSPMNTASQPN